MKVELRKKKDAFRSGSRESRGVLARSRRMITNFLENNDVPGWYRGMSWFQTHAADEMQSAIRDDVQQDSVFRVEHVLTQIGLVPLPSQKLLKIIMRISRGNDLAFLWFLMEAYYKTDDKSYNINEQLLMSMIAHLDMVTTLRELDRILPPPNCTKTKSDDKKPTELRAQKEREKKKKKKLKEIKKPAAGLKINQALPYFERLVRRKIRRSVFQSKMPNVKAGVDMYASYRDPTYEVPNEATRWFASYQLNPNNRLATALIRREIEEIFAEENNRLIKSITSQIIDHHLVKSVVRNKISLHNIEAMCTTHRIRREEKRDIERERLVKKRAECLKLLDVDAYKKKQRVKRILAQLKKDVETMRIKNAEVKKKERGKSRVILMHDNCLSEHMVSEGDSKYCQRFAMQHACDARHVLELSKACSLGLRLTGGQTLKLKNETDEANVEEIDDQSQSTTRKHKNETDKAKEEEMEDQGQTEHEMKKGKRGGDDQSPTETETDNAKSNQSRSASDTEADTDVTDEVKVSALSMRLEGGQDQLETDAKPEAGASKQETAQQLWCPTRVAILAKDGARTHKLISSAIDDRPLNFNHREGVSTPSTSEKFFIKPTDHKPYEFNYPKIFEFKTIDKDMQQLKNALLDELDGPQPGVKKTKDGMPDYRAVVDKCATKTFEKQVDSLESEQNKRSSGLREIFPGVPQQDSYDCNDRVLMNKMLKGALKEMSTEPKFVLASMPDAHKMPVLREWIYRRFGKKYTHQELEKLGKLSMQIFAALRQIPFVVQLPRAKELGDNMHVSYNCRKYLIKKSTMLKKKFYARYDDAIMRLARDYWFAMCPHLYPKAPPKTTFFAYMPPHTLAINHFRPWKPDEYMNAKLIWDRKMRARSKKQQ